MILFLYDYYYYYFIFSLLVTVLGVRIPTRLYTTVGNELCGYDVYIASRSARSLRQRDWGPPVVVVVFFGEPFPERAIYRI